MGFGVILFVLNIFLFILSKVLQLVQVILVISLVSFKRANGVKSIKDIDNKLDIAKYLWYRSIIFTVTLSLIVVRLLLLLLSGVTIFLGFAFVFLIFAIIVAGAYIVNLNSCRATEINITHGSYVAGDGSSSGEEGSSLTRGDSSSAGQGAFTEEAGTWAKGWGMTYIGDSLGVGVQAPLSAYFSSANFDVDSSRGIISIKGQRTGETGIQTLKRLKDAGQIRENLVVALGTNNDVSLDALQKFYAEIPSSVKTITWVLTASEGGVPNGTINSTIKDFVNSHENMRYLDWKAYVDSHGGWSKFNGGDGIHMSGSGYAEYAKFQTQGLYDLYGKGSSKSSGSGEKKQTALGGISKYGEFGYLVSYLGNQLDTIASQKVYAEESEKEGSKENKEENKEEGKKEEKKDSKKGKATIDVCGTTITAVGSLKGSGAGSSADSSSSDGSSVPNGEVGYLYNVPYIMTQGYGATNYAASGAYAIFQNKWHSGVDMVASTGTRAEIKTPVAGKVYYVNTDLSFGYFITLKIDGGFLTFEHLAENPGNKWSVGQDVPAGTVIGLEGSTGPSTGSHLHFQYNPGTEWNLSSLTHGHASPKDYMKGVDPSQVDGPYFETHKVIVEPK